jgi:hypothetical protein
MLFAVAVSDMSAEAEGLWVQLARVLPQPWRAEVLTQLAFFAYVRGGGPLAGIALQAALDIDESHRMANMLDTALQAGMPPAKIRDLAEVGYRLAEETGVVLPARREQSVCSRRRAAIVDAPAGGSNAQRVLVCSSSTSMRLLAIIASSQSPKSTSRSAVLVSVWKRS